MNRFNLPDINFLDKDPRVIESNIMKHIESKTGLALSNADPRRKFVQGLVLYISQERNDLDYALKQNLLAYAEDEYLDHKGEEVSTPRLKSKAAYTIMQFKLEEERVDVLLIPQGTRFLVGENIFFETDEVKVVPVGQVIIDIKASCMEPGTKGNGYLPGEITNLVDPIAWVKEVKNITITSGGVDIEHNDDYAERIRIAPESFSVAGSEGAYEYWAKTASQDIADVKISNPSAGIVDIRVLLKNGGIPSQELLNQVLNTCSAKVVRPLTDKVTVGIPEIVSYEVDVQYWVPLAKETVLSSIQKQINDAFQTYLIWQKEKMGRDVDLSELITRLKGAGAARVAVNSPMYIKVERHQVANESLQKLTYGGLADE